MHLGLVFGFQFSVFGTTEQTKTKTKTNGAAAFFGNDQTVYSSQSHIVASQHPRSNIQHPNFHIIIYYISGQQQGATLPFAWRRLQNPRWNPACQLFGVHSSPMRTVSSRFTLAKAGF